MTTLDSELTAELARIQDKLRTVSDPLAMLQALFAFAPFGLQVYGADGRSMLVNRAFREMYGSEPPASYCIFQDELAERAGVAPLVRRAFDGEAVHIPAMWYDPRDLEHVDVEHGNRVAHEVWMIPLFDSEQRVTHVAIVAKDVTTELNAKELASREAEARRAADRARDRVTRIQLVTSGLASAAEPREVARVLLEQGISALGAGYGVVATLRSEDELELLATYGLAAEVVEAWSTFPLSSRIPPSEAIRADTPIFAESEAQILERFPDMADETRRLGLRTIAAIPLAARGEAIGAVAFGFDAAHPFDLDDRSFLLGLAWQGAQALERARLYREAQEVARRAEEASRAKDEFLSVLSHELRTPLNAIQGWAHIIESTRDADPSVIDRGVEVILRNVRAQVTLIDDMLDVARIIRGKLRLAVRRCELAPIVDAAVESVRPSAIAKGVDIDIDVPTGVRVVADVDRIQQVVWNLLSNAIKFTPRGGRVSVATRVSDDAVTLAVKDTGQGLAASDIPYVFDRFRQVDSSTTRAKGGLGLGLSIVRHLVEAHGGQVRAESPGLGKGTTFEVELPTNVETSRLAPPSEAPPPLEPAPALPLTAPRALTGTRVLVVDDELDAVELLAFVLEADGANVCVATSARAALEALESFTPDVLISDIGMPGEDGYSLLRRVRIQGGALATLPAIALTAYARREDVDAALAAGFAWHVTKPVEPRQLVRVVAEAVRSSPNA
jgi:signal transduction histidine kinase/ActR/RegA family two-component response regulator